MCLLCNKRCGVEFGYIAWIFGYSTKQLGYSGIHIGYSAKLLGYDVRLFGYRFCVVLLYRLYMPSYGCFSTVHSAIMKLQKIKELIF
jgi:hypothetical protein